MPFQRHFKLFQRNRKQEQDRARRKAEAEADKRRGFFIPVRGKVSPLPIIYGKQIVGGTELNHRVLNSITPTVTAASNAFKRGRDFESGTHDAGKNSYLMFNTALCNTQGTRIESVELTRMSSTLSILVPWVLHRAVLDRKSTRLNSSHLHLSRMPSSA